MFYRNRKKGFTLVELLIVVLILAALAAIAVPRMVASADTAKINACNTNIDLINTQIELYRASNGTAPTLATLFADPNYFPDGAPDVRSQQLMRWAQTAMLLPSMHIKSQDDDCEKHFSIIELLIVVLFLGIFAYVAVPRMQMSIIDRYKSETLAAENSY